MQQNLYSYTRLKDYALWYYFRYYPSNKKLLIKLKEKGGEKGSKKVFSEIKYLLQEEEIIISKIENYIFGNKNYRYIRQKMAEKFFPKESVEKYLEKYIASGKSILDENFLRKKIENYASKGKSRYYIFQTLGETAQDRKILEKLLADYFPNGETENILKEYKKIENKYSREKCIQKLIAKGFRYDDIKKALDT